MILDDHNPSLGESRVNAAPRTDREIAAVIRDALPAPQVWYDVRMTSSRATLRRLVRARDVLHASVQRGATLDDLAAASGLSRGFLARSFARAFGVPPHQYLVQLRLDRAKRALARGASVTETCLEVGFESLGSFSASFHRRVGVSPRAWQRQARGLVQGLGVPALYIPACFLARYVEHV